MTPYPAQLHGKLLLPIQLGIIDRVTETTGKTRKMGAQWTWLIPALALGLFLGRILSEWLWASWPLPLLITLITVGISIALLRNHPFHRFWPLCLLLLYVFYPYPDPNEAIGAAILVVITLALSSTISINLDDQGRRLLPIGLASIVIGIGFLLLYLFTISPDILPADSGEFQLIASELGVAHPPGFPLYTVLAHLMTRLPLGGTAAYKVNLFSVIMSTLTLLLIFLSVHRLTNSVFAGITSAVALGASTTFWAQATTANIRSLMALFTALLFYILIMITRPDGIIPSRRSRYKDLEQEEISALNTDTDPTRNHKPILMALFFLVLTAGVTHHASLVFIGILALIFLILADYSAFRNPHIWLLLVGAILLGLVPLLYLPLRGNANAIGSPADISSFNGFFNHILALGFRGDFFYFVQPTALWARLMIMANVMTFQFPTLLLIFMIAGLILLAIRDISFALFLGGAFALHTLIAAIYRAPQTVEYMIPAYIPAVISLGYFVGEMNLWRQVRRKPNAATWQSSLAALFMAMSLLIVSDQLFDNFQSFRWLHKNMDTRDYAQFVLENAPENSVVLADWHWVTPMRYLQTVEGIRPDVEIHYVFPTEEQYGDTWARRINELLDEGQDVVVTHFDEFAYRELPLSQPLGEAFLFSQEPLLELPPDYTAYSIALDDSIQLLGYELESEAVEVGQEAVISVAWQSASDLEADTSLFVHLVGPDGQIYGQSDLPALDQEEGITITQFRVTTRPNSVLGEYTLYIGANNPDAPLDRQNNTRIPVSHLEVELASRAPMTMNPAYRPLAADPTSSRLIGYDWDNTLIGLTRLYLHWQTEEGFRTQVEDLAESQFVLPEVFGPWGYKQQKASIFLDKPATYVPFGQGIAWIGRPGTDELSVEPGHELRLNQRFVASTPILRDFVVSMRLVGYEDDGFHWSWWDLDDGVPAMGAIPTLKWIAGSTVQDPHWLTVNQTAWPGQAIEPLLRLYDAFSGRPLPILDERITEKAPWIPLGHKYVNIDSENN